MRCGRAAARPGVGAVSVDGYDGVSVDDIVREVGGSKTNVYSFYGGKDGLFLAVMDEILQDMDFFLWNG